MDRTALITDNLGLVRKMAHKYVKRVTDNALDYDDLYGEGCVGLIKAAEMFDETKGFKFSTFACNYIAGFILRSIRRKGFISVPHHVVDVASKIMKNRLEDASAEEIAAKLGYSLKWVEWGLHYLDIRSVPMDKRDHDDEGTPIIFGAFHEDYSTAFVLDFMDTLKQTHKEVVLRVLDGKDYRTIGDEFGISYQAIGNRMRRVKQHLAAYQAAANGET
jgi:DNA-directed RNA polymerase specialized sigma subunit